MWIGEQSHIILHAQFWGLVVVLKNISVETKFNKERDNVMTFYSIVISLEQRKQSPDDD